MKFVLFSSIYYGKYKLVRFLSIFLFRAKISFFKNKDKYKHIFYYICKS